MMYHWPTTDGWITVVALCLLVAGVGGWGGLAAMIVSMVFISVLGNIILP